VNRKDVVTRLLAELGDCVSMDRDAYRMAMLGLQSEQYRTDAEFRDAVDAVLAHFGLARQSPEERKGGGRATGDRD
jgi:hypothetical protein